LFTIQHIQDQECNLNYIELKNTTHNSYAKIHLNLGGSLQELVLNTKTIIKNLQPLSYDISFASAILFPFTCRIKNGVYSFKQQHYTLDLNLKEENNAIHGLVYNKNFEHICESISDNAATVTIGYNQTEKNNGFPFIYSIILTYRLSIDGISLEVTIKNTDSTSFPFNIGWHPYFCSSNLYDSYLSLKSDKKLLFDKDMIPVKAENIALPSDLQIKDEKFDDCFILSNKSIGFKTPDYRFMMSSSSKENYFQVFTLNKINAIALEFLTGPANSFNNKLGLRELNPKETYTVNWDIKLTEDE